MGTMWLMLALVQVPDAAAVRTEFEKPRFAIGADLGTALAYAGEGGGLVGGAGIRATVPIGERTALTARIMHAVPELSAGMYEIRWQRSVNWPGSFTPDYAGVGVVGVYWLETGLFGRVKPRLEGVSLPQVVSFTAGWHHRPTSRLMVPIEISAFAHPYGAVAASATIGLTWSRASRAPEL